MNVVTEVFESAYYLHALAAAVAGFAVGFVWYMPPLFGSAWLRAVGLTQAKASKANMPAIFGTGFVLLYAMAVVLSGLGASGAGIWEGAQTGLVYGGVFVLATTAMHLMYAQRPLSLIAFEGLHDVAALMAMGAVLGAFETLPRLPF